MKVAKQRLPPALRVFQPEKLAVERVGELPRATAAIERVGGAMEARPILQHEIVPRRVVPEPACASEREVFEVKRHQVAFAIRGTWGAIAGPVRNAAFECFGEGGNRHAPALSSCSAKEPPDQGIVDTRHSRVPRQLLEPARTLALTVLSRDTRSMSFVVRIDARARRFAIDGHLDVMSSGGDEVLGKVERLPLAAFSSFDRGKDPDVDLIVHRNLRFVALIVGANFLACTSIVTWYLPSDARM